MEGLITGIFSLHKWSTLIAAIRPMYCLSVRGELLDVMWWGAHLTQHCFIVFLSCPPLHILPSPHKAAFHYPKPVSVRVPFSHPRLCQNPSPPVPKRCTELEASGMSPVRLVSYWKPDWRPLLKLPRHRSPPCFIKNAPFIPSVSPKFNLPCNNNPFGIKHPLVIQHLILQ